MNTKNLKEQLIALLPRLWRFAMSLTACRDTSEDLVQATCERALSRASQWQQGTHLDRWVFSILHSIWKNELRARSIRGQQCRADFDEVPDTTADSGETAARLAEIVSAVQGLPDAQRVLVILVCVEGYKYREAAEMLRIPIGTVMSRLAQARLTLGRHEAAARVAR